MSIDKDVLMEGVRAAEGFSNLAAEDVKERGATKFSELVYFVVGNILANLANGTMTEHQNSVAWILHTAVHEYADGDLPDIDLAGILIIYASAFRLTGDNPVSRYIDAVIPDKSHVASDSSDEQHAHLRSDGLGEELEMVYKNPFVGGSDQNPMFDGLPTSPGLFGFIITTKNRA